MARKPKSAEENMDRHDEILAAAVSVFSEKGYSGATTSQVAKAAGVAEGTIFRYFKTKKELLSAIVMTFISSLGGDIVLSGVEKIVMESDGKDLRVVLKEILKDRLRLLHRMMPVFQVVLTEALYHPEIRNALHEDVLKRAMATVQPGLTRLEESGELRSGLSRETIMRTIIGAFASLIAQSVFTGMSETSFEAEADCTIDLLYHGLICKKEKQS